MINRSKRVAVLLKTEISNIIRTRIKDPLIGFVTITDVVLSPDLKIAKVYFSVLGNESQKQNSLKGLKRARPFIQNEMAMRVKLRYMPILKFFFDESFSYGAKIDRILQDLNMNKLTTENND